MALNVDGNTALADKTLLENEEIKAPEQYEDKKIVYNVIKRIIDIIGGIIGILILIPMTSVLCIVNIFTKENEGPIFYDQLRVGKNGKEFKIYKFRSMVMHADEKLAKYLEENEEAREEYKKYKKLKNDPRITKMGNFLRKTSLDEFPQFINVLEGSMSLVGPRPYLYREIEDMGDNYNEIIKVKPGITGFWQVNGRSNVDFKNRLNMDVDYIKNRSLWLDFKLLIKTVFWILGKRGAI